LRRQHALKPRSILLLFISEALCCHADARRTVNVCEETPPACLDSNLLCDVLCDLTPQKSTRQRQYAPIATPSSKSAKRGMNTGHLRAAAHSSDNPQRICNHGVGSSILPRSTNQLNNLSVRGGRPRAIEEKQAAELVRILKRGLSQRACAEQTVCLLSSVPGSG